MQTYAEKHQRIISSLARIAGINRIIQNEYHQWYRAVGDRNEVRKTEHMRKIVDLTKEVEDLVQRPCVQWLYEKGQKGRIPMPQLEEIFASGGSGLLAAKDLEEGKQYKFKISAVEIKEFKGKNDRGEETVRMKPVLSFENDDRRLIVNVTNGKLIGTALNETNTDNWPGREITLFYDPTVEYDGRKGGIRALPF